MQEEFLHYIWKHKKFQLFNLTTSSNENLEILSVGLHNLNSGPDFFNAKLKIDNQLWAGNVEIHINSSDWYVHKHETDKNYDNVILHVVWNDDVVIFRKDNTLIPTLELKEYVLPQTLKNYYSLLSKKKQWINCEKDIADVDNFTINNWLERLYLERLERKSDELHLLLKKSKNNWEEVLFKMLAKNFGLKINGEAFLSLAESFDFSTLRKQQNNLQNLEAILFGQANLLNKEIEDSYYTKLNESFNFLKHKYKLNNQAVLPIHFFRLRPLNFPTIRLSQLATLYNKNQNLFSEIINCNSKKDLYNLFDIQASEYWKAHFTFGKVSKKSDKKISKAFIYLLLVNSVIPVIFAYSKFKGNSEEEKILKLIQEIKPEKNSIINKFKELKLNAKSALVSQALIELKTNYCSKNKCLHCAIGSALLNRNM